MYAPTAFCYDCFDEQPDALFFLYNTNGSAISFSLWDSVIHGFLELVERDAVGIWWYNRVVRPRVHIDTFSDELLDRMVQQHDARGRKLTVFDVTNDLNIPVFAAMSQHALGEPPLFGFGAHFDARNALRRAFTELGQALYYEDQIRRKWQGFNWSQQFHLTHQAVGEREAKDYVRFAKTPTVATCAAVAASIGSEIFFVDCTRADIGLPAVKVIVPGLRHIWPHFGSGRLFDVPVSLGWLTESTDPLHLNPEHLR